MIVRKSGCYDTPGQPTDPRCRGDMSYLLSTLRERFDLFGTGMPRSSPPNRYAFPGRAGPDPELREPATRADRDHQSAEFDAISKRSSSASHGALSEMTMRRGLWRGVLTRGWWRAALCWRLGRSHGCPGAGGPRSDVYTRRRAHTATWSSRNAAAAAGTTRRPIQIIGVNTAKKVEQALYQAPSRLSAFLKSAEGAHARHRRLRAGWIGGDPRAVAGLNDAGLAQEARTGRRFPAWRRRWRRARRGGSARGGSARRAGLRLTMLPRRPRSIRATPSPAAAEDPVLPGTFTG